MTGATDETPLPPPAVRVTTAEEAAAADRRAIDAGVPSRALMQRAGAAAAGEIARRHARAVTGGVAVFAGTGNNGGDAWVVAAALRAAGVSVRVRSLGEPRTDDGRAEHTHALAAGALPAVRGDEALVVDGLLGTGATGMPRGDVALAIERIAEMRARGAVVVSLDVPSGVDATTGAAEGAVVADLTLTFGTLKRGLALARAHSGEIAVLDIGLGSFASGGDGVTLFDERDVAAAVSTIAPDAHKGTRRKLAVVGGGPGMAGAAALAGRAAWASGVGMVRLVVAHASIAAVQAVVPQATAAEWPVDDADADDLLARWADVLLLGPGLGASSHARALVERALTRFAGPVVVDADALNVFAGDLGALRTLLADRPAVLTPHPAELGRLMQASVERVLDRRFDVGRDLARTVGAVVLLKGVPTVVSAPDGRRAVSARGTAALAAGGSGDVLGGIVATLLAQTGDPFGAALAGAWAHGRAAELATAAVGGVRGTTLDHVLAALPAAWRMRGAAATYPVLAELPAPPP